MYQGSTETGVIEIDAADQIKPAALRFYGVKPEACADHKPQIQILELVVFVIVEGRGTSSAGTGSATPAAYRISVWRVVLHSPNNKSTTNTIPHKET